MFWIHKEEQDGKIKTDPNPTFDFFGLHSREVAEIGANFVDFSLFS